MKILIVSIYFPPYNSIASLRPYSWAKWWSRQGHEVTILTMPKIPQPQDFPMPCDGFEVVELPLPGLELIKRFRSGKRVVQKTEPMEADQIRKSLIGQLLRIAINRLQRHYGVFSTCRMPDIWDLWAWSAARWAMRQQWDAVVSTGGPYSVHWIGLALKRKRLVRFWGLDWRDLWTNNHIFPGLPLVRSLERHLEKRFHDAADVITTVSEPLAATLRKLTRTPVSVIFNGFDPEDYAALDPEPAFPADGAIRIVYTGTVYAGKRDPTPLFLAVRQLHDLGAISPDKLRIMFAGSNCDSTETARAVGVDQYCEYAGFLPRPEALRMQRDADLLLFLEFESPGVEGILTGKLFEYLAAGPQIWAVGVGSKSSAGCMINEYGRGRAFGKDVDAIREALLETVTTKHKNPATADLSMSLDALSRESQALHYLELLKL